MDNANTQNGAQANPAPLALTPQKIEELLTLPVRQLSHVAESQQTAILAMTAILAVMAETGKLPADRLGAVVSTLTAGRADAEAAREKIAAYLSLVINISKKLPEIIAGNEAAVAAEKAKKN